MFAYILRFQFIQLRTSLAKSCAKNGASPSYLAVVIQCYCSLMPPPLPSTTVHTKQAAYPPSHYIRRVPQRKLHMFTGTQLIQLVILCAVGFAPSPYVKLFFPMLLVIQILIRFVQRDVLSTCKAFRSSIIVTIHTSDDNVYVWVTP